MMKVKLNQSVGRLSERTPFFIADNSVLEYEFDTEYRLDHWICAFSNGEKVARINGSGKTVAVPPEMAVAGELHAELSLIIAGSVVKKWRIEPLLICDTSPLRIMPEIEELRDENAKLKQCITELKSAVESALSGVETRLQSIEKQVQGLENDPLRY